MAFPTNPVNGQTYGNKRYDASKSAWVDNAQAVETTSSAIVGTWEDFTPSVLIAGLPGSWGQSCKHRRNGENEEFELYYNVTGAATGALQFNARTMLSSLKLTISSDANMQSIISAVAAGSTWLPGVYPDGMNFYSSTGQWSVSSPFTWKSSDAISMKLSFKVDQYVSNVNLATDFTEYASNSNVTALDDNASFLNSVGGSPVPNVGIGYGVTRKIKWDRQRQDTDIEVVEIYNPTSKSWDDAEKKYPYVKFWSASNGVVYSVGISRQALSATEELIVFGAGGLAFGANPSGSSPLGDIASSQSWATLFAAGWMWRVRKVSNGDMSETPEAILATGVTAGSVPVTTSWLTLKYVPVNDPRKMINASTGAITIMQSGKYQINWRFGYKTNSLRFVLMIRNETQNKETLALVIGQNTEAQILFPATIEANMGDVIYLKVATAEAGTFNTISDSRYDGFEICWVGK